MKVILKISVFVGLLISFITKAQALELSTSEWETMEEQLDRLETGDLLVSDVMSVIFYQGDRLISQGGKKIYKSFLRNIEKDEGLEKRRMLEGTVKQSFKPAVVSQELLDYMKKIIEDNNIKFIILTAGKTGKLGPIEELMDLRKGRIKQLGLNLEGMFPVNNIELNKLSECKHNKPSIYNDGIIFTHRNDKGESLAAFLDEVNFAPKKIVFIDNNPRQIESVKRMCESRNIEYVGIHYTKIYEITAEPVDSKIAEKQLTFLKNKMIWLRDNQAQCMIDNNDDYELCQQK